MVADGLPCARLLQFDRQHRAVRVSRPHARVLFGCTNGARGNP